MSTHDGSTWFGSSSITHWFTLADARFNFSQFPLAPPTLSNILLSTCFTILPPNLRCASISSWPVLCILAHQSVLASLKISCGVHTNINVNWRMRFVLNLIYVLTVQHPLVMFFILINWCLMDIGCCSIGYGMVLDIDGIGLELCLALSVVGGCGGQGLAGGLQSSPPSSSWSDSDSSSSEVFERPNSGKPFTYKSLLVASLGKKQSPYQYSWHY